MKNRLIVALVFGIIIVLGLSIAFKSVDYSAFNDDNSIVLNTVDFSPDFSAVNFIKPGIQHKTYSIDIPKERFVEIESEHYDIIFNRLSDNAHSVYFNDILIGSQGDSVKGNSNLWNGVFKYPISANLLSENNTLRIETTATYRSGLSTDHVYISRAEITPKVLGSIDFYGRRVNTVLIGFICFSALIILIFYYLNGKEDSKYLYASLATLMTGIYYSDYLTIGYMDIPYFIYKKFIMMNLFLGICFYAYTIASYYNSKIIKRLGHLTMILTILMVIFSPNMIVFKKLYMYAYFLILMNVFTWLWFSIKEVHKKLVAFIFTIGFFTLGVYGSITVIMDITNQYFQMNSPVVYISVFSAIPLLLIYEAIQERELLLVKEKSLREIEFKNSMTDSLTETWNQRFMSTIFGDRQSNYTMALIDIDNFKGVNDTYGHLVGDQVLIGISDILKSILNPDDIICRYGGDEFILMLKNQKYKDVQQLIEKMRIQVEQKRFQSEMGPFGVTISIGLEEATGNKTVESVFSTADMRLYQAKANGKNEVIF